MKGPRPLLPRCREDSWHGSNGRAVRTNCVSAGLKRGRRAVAAKKEAWSAFHVPEGSSFGRQETRGPQRLSPLNILPPTPSTGQYDFPRLQGGGVSDPSPSSPLSPAQPASARPGPAQPPALTAPTAPAAPPLPRLLPNPLPALAAPPDPSRAGPGGSEHVGPLRPEPEAALRPASSPRWGLSRLLGGLLVSLCP